MPSGRSGRRTAARSPSAPTGSCGRCWPKRDSSAICELASGLWDDDAGGAWLADGRIVFSNGNSGLWQVSAQGGDPIEVLKLDPKQELDFHTASALPDGRSVIYVIHRAAEGAGADTLGIWSGGKARRMFESKGQNLDNPVYSPSGHILFERSPTNAGVWALPFSLKTLAATGEPFLVSPGTRGPSVASDGTLVVLPPRRRRPTSLAWADRGREDPGPRRRAPPPRPSRDFSGRRSNCRHGSHRRKAGHLALRSRAQHAQPAHERRRGRFAGLAQGRAEHPVREPHRVRGRGLDPAGRWPTARGAWRTSFRVRRARRFGARRPLVLRRARRGRMAPLVSISRGRKAEARSFSGPGVLLDRSIAIAGRPLRRIRGMVRPRCVGDLPASLPSVRRRLAGVLERRDLAALVVRWTALLRAGRRHPGGAVDHRPDVRLGAPTRLFRRTAPGGGNVPSGFDVSPDGKRFLIYEPSGDMTDERIVVALDWFAELRRGAGEPQK